jgi:hypothetical protein
MSLVHSMILIPVETGSKDFRIKRKLNIVIWLLLWWERVCGVRRVMMIHWTRVFYLGSRNETNGIMLNKPDSLSTHTRFARAMQLKTSLANFSV